MNAMIFAAGLGTRLKPLTNSTPKALVPFRGKTLLWFAIKSVVDAGATRVIVNVHHFADQIINYIQSEQWGVEVLISDERDELLDTGGGLVKAAPLFIPDQPILIRNADIVTSVDCKKIMAAHLTMKNNVTLMIKKRSTSRYLVFDEQMNLCAWKNVNTGERIVLKESTDGEDYGFSGIHVLDYKMLQAFGAQRPFSIIQGYLEASATTQIKGWVMEQADEWFDVGTVEKLKQAEEYYSKTK
ncbi:MAG: nucleotidyltransferase family protein [Marinilabiliaceae bacterium]|nr:nucleotidyltransferase family protein [Marinilabiliaceae bacterium]